MYFQEYINEKKNLYETLLNLLHNEDDFVVDFEGLLNNFLLSQNAKELKIFLYLLSNISENHHRHQNLIEKIEEIIIKLKPKIKQTLSNFQIFHIFRNNKRILFFLFQNEIIIPDESIINFMIKKNNIKFCAYFYTEIKSIIELNSNKYPKDFIIKLEKEFSLNSEDPNFLTSFNENRKNGENESYISSLIRNDSVEEFISYINKNNISIISCIKSSIYETNSFLLNEEPSLIEYAAFFGSIEIFQFVQLNNVDLNSSLWLYAIHGNNADIIHILEDNHIDPNNDKNFIKCLEESIKCHHNDVANYILNNKMNENIELNDYYKNHVAFGFLYHNYPFIPDDFDLQLIFYYSCQYDYYSLVEIFIKNKEIDINKVTILLLFLIKLQTIQFKLLFL